jgi:hypothetical protein
MTPMTALLQACHSALIDELCERHPEPKPELGLPSRLASWGPPTPNPSAAQACEFELRPQSGLLVLAHSGSLEPLLSMDLPTLSSHWLRRCGAEFLKRHLQPILMPMQEVTLGAATAPAALARATSRVSRLVWMPIRLGGDVTVFLGVAAVAAP